MTAALPLVEERPHVRADCAPGSGTPWSARPCQQTWCRHHGTRARFRGGNRDEASCSLDLAGRGGMTLLELGDLLGVSRERIRQVEQAALRKLRLVAEARGLRLSDLLPIGDEP